MILADTSIWVDLWRGHNQEMQRQLASGQIVMHPFIIAELALGSLRDRQKTLAALGAMIQVRVAQLAEVRQMIEVHSLYSRGIGLTDAHLIASCLLTPPTRLWTCDQQLQSVAEALRIQVNLP